MMGASGYAGEIGHQPFNPRGMACRCGNVGLLGNRDRVARGRRGGRLPDHRDAPAAGVPAARFAALPASCARWDTTSASAWVAW